MVNVNSLNSSCFHARYHVEGDNAKKGEKVLALTVFLSGMNSSNLNQPSPPLPCQPPPMAWVLNAIWATLLPEAFLSMAKEIPRFHLSGLAIWPQTTSRIFFAGYTSF